VADRANSSAKPTHWLFPVRDGIPVMLESEARILNVDERFGQVNEHCLCVVIPARFASVTCRAERCGTLLANR
jgi:hypothetical protein